MVRDFQQFIMRRPRSHEPFYFLFHVASEERRRFPIVHFHHQRIVILRFFARHEIGQLSCDVVGIDWNMDPRESRQLIPDRVLQGNLDPCVLLGPKERIVAKTAEILEQAGAVGHILNLGHGILPPTPIENARAFVEFAKSYRHSR